jgi:hypothetical protein
MHIYWLFGCLPPLVTYALVDVWFTTEVRLATSNRSIRHRFSVRCVACFFSASSTKTLSHHASYFADMLVESGPREGNAQCSEPQVWYTTKLQSGQVWAATK